MAEEMEFFNGIKMPALGLGTWQDPDEKVMEAVDTALSKGYRHIDTAYMYRNEGAIGRVIKKWLESGRLRRDELFIVTKLPVVGNRAECVEKYLKKSLKALQLNYVDLYLIHHPCGLLERGEDLWPTDDGGKLLLDLKTDHISLWKAMEAQVDAGRARSIGLCNFNARQLKRIIRAARIKPANLQVELHLYCQQKELAAFCKALDVTVSAFGPLGSPGLVGTVKISGHSHSFLMSPLGNPVVGRLAEKYHKTPAQILLRHILQRGIAAVPKSLISTRIEENLQVFDFKLSKTDMEDLNALDKGPSGRMYSIATGFADHPENPVSEPY